MKITTLISALALAGLGSARSWQHANKKAQEAAHVKPRAPAPAPVAAAPKLEKRAPSPFKTSKTASESGTSKSRIQIDTA